MIGVYAMNRPAVAAEQSSSAADLEDNLGTPARREPPSKPAAGYPTPLDTSHQQGQGSSPLGSLLAQLGSPVAAAGAPPGQVWPTCQSLHSTLCHYCGCTRMT